MNRIVLARAGCARPGARIKHSAAGTTKRTEIRCVHALPGVTRGDDGNDLA
ncbi:hypothetical protein [Burkholderia ubonensis]|uniref:hypothetical protein n=1 Tax=Burkholderia ubonensis TaxID=101571 RepID=UPI0012F92CAA|nr:hypothetical protein [Burkholderia ubonensis]